MVKYRVCVPADPISARPETAGKLALATSTQAGLLSGARVPLYPPCPTVCRPLIPIEVIQAVHLVLAVQGKTLVPDAPGTDHTGEAGRVEGLAQGPDDVLPDHLTALAALLQGVLGQRAFASEYSHTSVYSSHSLLTSYP